MRSSRLLAYDEGRCIGLAACTLSTEIGKPAALIPQNLLEVESTYHHIEPAGWCLSLKPILPIAVLFCAFQSANQTYSADVAAFKPSSFSMT
jgi:hypothetical protein